jgi:multidrug resistance efflux pump
MNDLLNPIQKNSVRITLRRFEENLLHAQAWLDGKEENGVLYQRKLTLSAGRRQRAEKDIKTALDLIRKMSQDFELLSETENAAAQIKGEMAIIWADLLDSRARELKRSGAVHPELSAALDPGIQALASIALALTTIFSD